MPLLPTRTALAVLFLALAGCMSTPEASRERDAEAKQFKPRADAAVIYVYRDDVGASGMASDDPVLYVDDRLIGSTLPLTYFRFDVRAGEHLLHGYGYDQGRLRLFTRNGETYFVSLTSVSGTSFFRLVKPETGRREILRCCTLLENWAPSQRPFLY
jgi:hypothetical protein